VILDATHVDPDELIDEYQIPLRQKNIVFTKTKAVWLPLAEQLLSGRTHIEIVKSPELVQV
jgi:hypothetical protein